MSPLARPWRAALCFALLGLLPGGMARAASVGDAEVRAAVDLLHPEGESRRYWVDEGERPTRQMLALLSDMQDAKRRGLDPEDYAVEDLRRRAAQLPQSGPAAAAAFDHDFTHALARYLVHLERGRVRPEDAGYALAPRRLSPDLPALLRTLATATDGIARLDAVEPRYRHFALLKRALHRYRELAAAGPDITLPALSRRSVHPGEPYPDVMALRRRLRQLGDLPASASVESVPLQLDDETVAGLKAFQQRHGLAADGVLGEATRRELNLPLAHRLRQLEWSMERVRWLPPPPDGPFIVVNIPQFRLFAFRGPVDAEQAMTAMNVIVGKTFPRFRTPVFMADIRQVVFRPYWDVPRNILRNELLPDLRRNPSLVEREGYEAVRGQRDDSPVVPWSNAVLEELATGQLRLRQRPGPKNALGGVKFLLPNPYDVYLHSTPAQRLFGQSRRAFSHGCVRVEDPVALARFVLEGETDWEEGRIQSAMIEGPASARLTVKRPIPVMVFYATAVASEDGRVRFFDDLYGHDKRLEALLRR